MITRESCLKICIRYSSLLVEFSLVVLTCLTGCGYTVLKKNLAEPQEQPICEQDTSDHLDTFAERLYGSWRGFSSCYDHGRHFIDSVYWCEFSRDGTVTIEYSSKTFKGVWTLVEISGDVEIILKGKERWPPYWNGGCIARFSDNTLLLFLSRPTQFGCRAQLFRIGG